MIFEMTLDYNVILPITITVALSYGTRTLLSRESIYTLKLNRRGHVLPQMLQTNFHQIRQAREVMTHHFGVIPESVTLEDISRRFSDNDGVPLLLVENQMKQVVGTLARDDFKKIGGLSDQNSPPGAMIDRRFEVAKSETPLLNLLIRMERNGASVALISDREGGISSGEIRGFIRSSELGEALAQSLEIYSE